MGKISLFRGIFYEQYDRCVKRPRKWPALSTGALLWNLEWVHLLELLRKKKGISGFLFFEPEDIKSKVWGPSGTLARNRAPLS